MGKATRWFKGLLGMKKDKENVDYNSNCGEKKDKTRRRSFAKSGKDFGGLSLIPVNIPATDSVRLRSYIADTEKEQNKHEVAVAAATAAAANAAVTAALRLTNQGRGGMFSGGREKRAAIKIQTVFRGYLARKALRALKGLVKLQALVRGYLVRKRAAATFHSMRALIRAQATARYQRARRATNDDHRLQSEVRARKYTERFVEARSGYHNKRPSASYDPSPCANDESPKIVEMDTCLSKSRSRRMTTCMSDYGDDHYYHAMYSPLPCPVPARLSIPDCRHLQDFDWGFVADDHKFATSQSTPRLTFSGRARVPVTPPRSICEDSFFRPYSNSPSYMANTQSFRAKLRSNSAPKPRPESCPKKRLSLDKIMASRTSFSGVRMQRS